MKKVAFLLVAVLALVALGGVRASYAQGQSITVTLTEQNGSGQNGTAVLTDMGDQTQVVINISGGSATAQPAHIHDGTCANLNPKPKYPLTSVVNGTSTTMVPVKLSDLTDEPYAINIHKSGTEASVYVSCGDIMAMMTSGGGTSGGEMGGEGAGTPGMPSTGSGDMAGTLVLLGLVGLALTGTGLKLARRKA
jgi:hypothetical protein